MSRVIATSIAWAGQDFALMPGDEIEVPDETADARVEAGVAVETNGEGYVLKGRSAAVVAEEMAHMQRWARPFEPLEARVPNQVLPSVQTPEHSIGPVAPAHLENEAEEPATGQADPPRRGRPPKKAPEPSIPPELE